jgi:hypothetical protein
MCFLSGPLSPRSDASCWRLYIAIFAYDFLFLLDVQPIMELGSKRFNFIVSLAKGKCLMPWILSLQWKIASADDYLINYLVTFLVFWQMHKEALVHSWSLILLLKLIFMVSPKTSNVMCNNDLSCNTVFWFFNVSKSMPNDWQLLNYHFLSSFVI